MKAEMVCFFLYSCHLEQSLTCCRYSGDICWMHEWMSVNWGQTRIKLSLSILSISLTDIVHDHLGELWGFGGDPNKVLALMWLVSEAMVVTDMTIKWQITAKYFHMKPATRSYYFLLTFFLICYYYPLLNSLRISIMVFFVCIAMSVVVKMFKN